MISWTTPLFRLACRTGATVAIGASLVTAAHAADNLVERTNRGLVELLTSGDAASIQMAQDLANVIDDGATRRLLPAVGRGADRNIIDLRALRGVDLSIVQTDVLDDAKRRHLLAGSESGITYIAKLHNEELHLLAGPSVKRIEELAGKKVDFDGGATVTGQTVLATLGIKVEPIFDDTAVALQKLGAGEIAAIAFVAAKPTTMFQVLQRDAGLHFLPVPLKPEMASAYVPARLTADDYPNLVAADAPVDTIAVGTAMMVANLPPNTERYRNVANFVDAFFTQFPRLQEAPRHPKWAEVNLAADLPGWKRFPPADQWLKRNVVAQAPTVDEKELHEIFARFLDERSRLSGGKSLSSEEVDNLFNQFRRWQTSQAH